MKRYLAMILALSLVWMLCACALQKTETPTESTVSASYIPGGLEAKEPAEEKENPEEKKETGSIQEKPVQEQENQMQNNADAVPVTEGQQFSNDAGTAIDVLREEIGETSALFGVAYIGYFNGAGGIDFGQWYEAVSSPWNAWYPFFGEIDQAHTIGTEGHLYCILGKEYETAISAKTTDGEVLYCAENGDPFLIFCNRNGDAQMTDTTVVVTEKDGMQCQWEAKLEDGDIPQLLIGENREIKSYVMTLPEEEAFDFDSWLAEGWLGLTPLGLAGENGMQWWISTWDNSVHYALEFYPNAPENGVYNGEAALTCYYSDDPTEQAQWEGWWSLETELQQPSRLKLDLMLMRGADKEAYRNAEIVSEEYALLSPPSGEQILLVAENKVPLLPIFPEGTYVAELSLPVG